MQQSQNTSTQINSTQFNLNYAIQFNENSSFLFFGWATV